MAKSRFAKFSQISAPPIRRMLTTERVRVLEKTLAIIDAQLNCADGPARREYLRQKRQETEAMLSRARKVAAKSEGFVSGEATL